MPCGRSRGTNLLKSLVDSRKTPAMATIDRLCDGIVEDLKARQSEKKYCEGYSLQTIVKCR